MPGSEVRLVAPCFDVPTAQRQPPAVQRRLPSCGARAASPTNKPSQPVSALLKGVRGLSHHHQLIGSAVAARWPWARTSPLRLASRMPLAATRSVPHQQPPFSVMSSTQQFSSAAHPDWTARPAVKPHGEPGGESRQRRVTAASCRCMTAIMTLACTIPLALNPGAGGGGRLCVPGGAAGAAAGGPAAGRPQPRLLRHAVHPVPGAGAGPLVSRNSAALLAYAVHPAPCASTCTISGTSRSRLPACHREVRASVTLTFGASWCLLHAGIRRCTAQMPRMQRRLTPAAAADMHLSLAQTEHQVTSPQSAVTAGYSSSTITTAGRHGCGTLHHRKTNLTDAADIPLQAQECFYTKAAADRKSPALLARIARQVGLPACCSASTVTRVPLPIV